MDIFLNGEPRLLANSLTVAELLQQLELAHRRLAVEINQEIIPRSTFASHCLQAGDRVEIVCAIGGG